MSEVDQFTVISEVYRNERHSKVLTRLPTNFYSIARDYLATQKEEYARAIQTPSSPKTMMLLDQIKKLEKRIKHIYEIRERKIALAALDSMGGAKPPDNMTRKDRELYELLMGVLESFRAGSEPPRMPEKPMHETITAPVKPEYTAETQPPAVPEPQVKLLEPETAPAKGQDGSIIVHVLEDMPDFVGPEHNYNLRKDDMISLPRQFASILSSRGKVRIVEG